MKLLKIFLYCLFFSLTLRGDGKADDLLLISAEKCNIQGVITALKKEANVNARTSYHDTALALSSKCGSLEIVKLLINKGAVVNTSNKWGDTPLHFAASAGNLEIVKLLVQKKADIYKKNYLHYTPLFSAAINGNLECVKYFIEELGLDVNSRDKMGMTLLMRVVYQEKEHFEVVRYLVERGAYINEWCQGKYRALHYAAMRGHNNTVEYLLKNKANANARSIFGETPLDLALKNNRILTAKIIKRYGGKEGAKY